jgi:hypothetical protein
MPPRLPAENEVHRLFDRACARLGIADWQREMPGLVIYDMTDGTRTSTRLHGKTAYIDGGVFVLRLLHMLKTLGARHVYINVIHRAHKNRVNYQEIYAALRAHIKLYSWYAQKYSIRLRFLGDFRYRVEPLRILRSILKRRLKRPSRLTDDETRKRLEEQEAKDGTLAYDLRRDIARLEKMTAKNSSFTAYFLINYSTKWASKRKKLSRTLPDVTAIIRHTKGYVNGDMWIYDKFDNNTFVYAQNGSSSVNWSDRQLAYLIALALRSMLLNRGTQLFKIYHGDESRRLRLERELRLSLIHRSFYPRWEKKFKKRVIIFSPVGPEIYEF